MGDGDTLQVHASCVAVDGRGVLLRGPPGSGKSDLALRLMDGGARLVADDRTDIALENGRLVASAPPVIDGLVEARGIGILRLDGAVAAPLCVVFDLVDPEGVERLPEPDVCEFLGVTVPRFDIAPFEASAPAKVRLAVRLASGDIVTPG